MTGHQNPLFFRAAAAAPLADVVSLFPGAQSSPGSSSSRSSSSRAAPARVALIGTFAPRKCGIATFTSDVFEQLGAYHPEIDLDVYALDDDRAPIAYDGVAGTIRQQHAEDYLAAARRINESGADAVWLQHEYGIFGGDDGELVCTLVDRIAAPLVLTLHTVLSEPSQRQQAILDHLLRRATRVMVMSQHGRELLLPRYDARPETVTVIPHGAPDRPFGRGEAFKSRLGLEGKNVLMTFGLLGPGKGLERAIDALPAIVARHPDTVYRIVGATHPNLVARDGETYREGLLAQAARLGVAHHIQWENRFLETDELLDQLEACDIYLTPYHNLQQATSGTLSYAVALGKAVVSTPYVHARELLADGVGMLIEPGCSSAIEKAVNDLLDDRKALATMQRRAYAAGRTTVWKCFADATAALVNSAVAPEPAEVNLAATPGLSGFFAMCDATGMLQHAIGIVPDRRHGYCLDDNARALMLVNCAAGLAPGERMRWQAVFAAFVQHAWNADAGRFRNFMNYDRTWCEDVGSDDSNGRALWALGQTVETSGDESLRHWALQLFETALPAMAEIGSPRAVAFAMLGAAAVERTVPGHEDARGMLRGGGEMLNNLLMASRRPDWAWFEAVLGYDNPRLSQALLEAGAALARREWVDAGLESLAWVAEQQVSSSGNFRPIGSESFGHEHAYLPFDQQPLEGQAAVEACASAWRVSGGDSRWLEHAVAAYRWFFGANDRSVVLADLATGRCRDGVTPRGRNENCGAESILAYQLAHYSMLALLTDEADSPAESTGATLEPGQRTTA